MTDTAEQRYGGPRLADRVVLITGSTKGIGRGIAHVAAAEGAKVVVSGRTESAGLEVVESIRAKGGEAIFAQCDVNSEEQVAAAVKLAVDTWGKLDGVVANAADLSLHVVDGPVTEISLEGWNKILASDLTSVFLTAKHAIRAMCEGDGGSVVLIASHSATEGVNGRDAYTAAKGGVISMTRSIASYYGRYNVRCNAIAVGMIDAGGSLSAARLADPVQRASITAHSLGLVGKPEDIGYAATYLLSEQARYTTGIIMPVDGGSDSASHIKRPNAPDLPQYKRKRADAPEI
jgi:NAD(P)-dependent dehydrogenase (short-subunit alcohol dehydrogenase family)